MLLVGLLVFMFLIIVSLTSHSIGWHAGFQDGFAKGCFDHELETQRMANITETYMNTQHPLPLPPSVIQFTVDSASTNDDDNLSYIDSPEPSYSQSSLLKDVTLE